MKPVMGWWGLLYLPNFWDPDYWHAVDRCHPDYAYGCCPGVEVDEGPPCQLSLF